VHNLFRTFSLHAAITKQSCRMLIMDAILFLITPLNNEYFSGVKTYMCGCVPKYQHWLLRPGNEHTQSYAVDGNESVLIETVPLGALVNRIVRHTVTKYRYLRTAYRWEHVHTLAMYMGNIRCTVVPKIQGGVQAKQWLQPIATVLWIFQITTH